MTCLLLYLGKFNITIYIHMHIVMWVYAVGLAHRATIGAETHIATNRWRNAKVFLKNTRTDTHTVSHFSVRSRDIRTFAQCHIFTSENLAALTLA